LKVTIVIRDLPGDRIEAEMSFDPPVKPTTPSTNASDLASEFMELVAGKSTRKPKVEVITA